MTKNESFEQWFNNQIWGNESWKEGLYQAWQAAQEQSAGEIAELEKEALYERDRLGYVMVDVIASIDALLNTAEEAELDGYSAKVAPIELFHEIENAFEKIELSNTEFIEKYKPSLLELKADNERLREALHKIRGCDCSTETNQLSRQVLATTPAQSMKGKSNED